MAKPKFEPLTRRQESDPGPFLNGPPLSPFEARGRKPQVLPPQPNPVRNKVGAKYAIFESVFDPIFLKNDGDFGRPWDSRQPEGQEPIPTEIP